ncbi:50S ribosomal protein L35ae [Candidatus Bathyarchaeota archaeon]|nr:50S ribosomal protein L35ae [Candidatus Bathyarchaeota archaeon]
MPPQAQGIIVNYRIGPKSQNSKECLIQFVNVKSSSEASKLIGRKVAWKHDNTKIIGKIVDLHGKKGLVRARFRKGLPGQSLGSTVELVG